LARNTIPDVLAEAARTPELAAVLGTSVREPRRAKAAELFERAVRRGELAPNTDIELAIDLLAGPL
jgi:Tetracyclin repressor-like, C-terminal domain